MAEYDIAFAERLATTAMLVAAESMETSDAARTVLYLALLSSEIALKAMLEKAGMPVSQIRKRSHKLKDLLDDLCRCTHQVEIVPTYFRSRRASDLRAVDVDPSYSNATVGTILEAEDDGASKYPNQIRYGDLLQHYPPGIVAKMSMAIIAWSKENWETLSVVHPVQRGELLRLGCSTAFSNKALTYSSMFANDYEAFIASIEEMLHVSRTATELDLEPRRIKTLPATLNSEFIQAQAEYNGTF